MEPRNEWDLFNSIKTAITAAFKTTSLNLSSQLCIIKARDLYLLHTGLVIRF